MAGAITCLPAGGSALFAPINFYNNPDVPCFPGKRRDPGRARLPRSVAAAGSLAIELTLLIAQTQLQRLHELYGHNQLVRVLGLMANNPCLGADLALLAAASSRLRHHQLREDLGAYGRG